MKDASRRNVQKPVEGLHEPHQMKINASLLLVHVSFCNSIKAISVYAFALKAFPNSSPRFGLGSLSIQLSIYGSTALCWTLAGFSLS
jgi:hypothetical protein